VKSVCLGVVIALCLSVYSETTEEQNRVDVEHEKDLDSLLHSSITNREALELSRNLCGPIACYFSIRHLKNANVSFPDIVAECGIASKGEMCDMLTIKRVCEAHGLRATSAYERSHVLQGHATPAILHYTEPRPHFALVLTELENDTFVRVDLNSPLEVSREELESGWDGYLILLDPGLTNWEQILFVTIILMMLLSPFFLMRHAKARSQYR